MGSTDVTRRQVVAGALLAGASVALAGQRRADAATVLGIRGADISFTLQEEAMGAAYRDDGGILPIERILANHGANYVRLRLWVNPIAATSDLQSALILARRAHAAGLGLLLDLHYSDTWADGRSQHVPSAWSHLDAASLGTVVRNYTRSVVVAFAEQGTPVDIVQIGNEINHGILWPVGRIYREDGEHWVEFAELLKAGAMGAREANPVKPPRIMLHADTGGDFNASRYFFDQVVAQGMHWDVIGLTYYPFWNGPLAALADNLAALASRYGKEIVVVETAYPWTLANGDAEPNIVDDVSALPEGERFPATEQGQLDYLEALRNVLAGVPGGRGAGFLAWEPGWLPGVPAAPGLGNAYDNLTMFDWTGRALPALKALRA